MILKIVNAFIRSKPWKSFNAIIAWKLGKATKARRKETEGQAKWGWGWVGRKSHRIHTVGPKSKIREHSKARIQAGHTGTIWEVDLKSSFEIMPN